MPKGCEMFTYFTQLLCKFESKSVRIALLVALAVLVAAILLGSFVRWLRRRTGEKPTSWGTLLSESIGGVLKVLIGLAILAGLCMHLSFESKEFSRSRGNVTETNYYAVKTIWGRPHVQREMYVVLNYYSTHYYNKDGMEIDFAKVRATTQPIGYRKTVLTHLIKGNPVVQADHDIDIRMNYRQKGGAWYTGFETTCRFEYHVFNFADRKVDMKFHFPLPTNQGLVDNFTVKVDGKPFDKPVVVSSNNASWHMYMARGKRHTITVSYNSRGLDHLRFNPGSGKKLQKYRIRMTCRGVAKDQLNYPIGCMTPTSIEEIGKDAVLTWQLDNAITRLDMGVEVPDREQEGYHVARMLAKAPWGLVLLIGAVLITYLARGRRPHWLPLLLLAVAYQLYYLLMAHLEDYSPRLAGAMTISAVTLTVLVAVLMLRRHGLFQAVVTILLFAFFCTAYPLIRISEHEGLLMSILYVVLLTYTILLVVMMRAKPPSAELK